MNKKYEGAEMAGSSEVRNSAAQADDRQRPGIKEDTDIVEEYEGAFKKAVGNDKVNNDNGDIVEEFEDALSEARRQEKKERYNEKTRWGHEQGIKVAGLVHRDYDPRKAFHMKNILNDFSDHDGEHTAEVMEKGERFQRAVESMAEKRDDIPAYTAVNNDTMQLALEMHDVGMAGKENQLALFEQSKNLKDDSESLRKEHAYRSAAMMLSDAKWLREQYGSNTEVEKAALIAYFHSKSAGGIDEKGEVTNLTDLSKLKESVQGFEKRYNEEQDPDGQQVDLSFIYNKEEELKQIATGASIARLADSKRDGERAITMLGEKIYPDYENFKPNPEAKNASEEVSSINVQYISEDGVRECTNLKSKIYAVGETNITKMEMFEQDGKLVHVFNISNADKFKLCINDMLREQVKEIDSGIFSESNKPEGSRPFNKIKINLKDCDEQSTAAFKDIFNKKNPIYENVVEWGDK